jgi:hypothetical protein
VDVRQGPVERRFGIASLVVRTAGGGGQADAGGTAVLGPHVGILQGIADPKALRDRIMRRAAESRGAGLGDDRTESAASSNGQAWSPAHVAVLREIRDHAVALRG